ncbi:MAG: hypothetical protein RLZZ380_859 [Actinomycetota bacterium]|jgi:hypothetical protein
MSSLIAWIPLAVSLLVLLGALASLRTKGLKLQRQLERTERYRENFESRTIPVKTIVGVEQIPTMGEALAQRGAFLNKRTKKRADKQRRLVARLKSRS